MSKSMGKSTTYRLGTIALLAFGLTLGPVRAEGPVQPIQKVLDCMRDNIPPTLRIQEVELSATDRGGGTRVLKGRIFAIRDKGLIRAMMRIAEPTDLAGAAYLVRETDGGHSNETYMFLPSLNRVRRINGASASGSLLGTDFSYDDIKQLENAFDDTLPTLEKPAQIENRPTYVLSIQPKAGQVSPYSVVRSWVDQKTCVALKVDFFVGNTLRKEMTSPAAGLQQSGKFWFASPVQMRDLKENTSSRLNIVGMSSGDNLAARYFDPHDFYLGN